MTTQLINVEIPGPSASTSKMSRKGWKCWGKRLTHVRTPANDGYAFEGEFVGISSTMELTVGDVILHVDQSSSATLGVVMVNRLGKGFIKWVADADSDGRKWCGPLARPARRWLDMDVEDRVRHVAQLILDQDTDNELKPESREYWQSLVSPPSAEPTATEATAPAKVTPDALVCVLANALRNVLASRRDEMVRRQTKEHNADRQAAIDILGDEYRAVYEIALRAGLETITDEQLTGALPKVVAMFTS